MLSQQVSQQREKQHTYIMHQSIMHAKMPHNVEREREKHNVALNERIAIDACRFMLMCRSGTITYIV